MYATARAAGAAAPAKSAREAAGRGDGVKVHSPVLRMQALNKRITRYLRVTMPESARRSTGGNMRVLMFLANHPHREVCQRDIEKAFGITRSTASRELALLEGNGMISRHSVERDARLKRLTLTAKASEVIRDLGANFGQMESRLFAGFSPSEIDQFGRFVDRMRDNIERAMPADPSGLKDDGAFQGEDGDDGGDCDSSGGGVMAN